MRRATIILPVLAACSANQEAASDAAESSADLAAESAGPGVSVTAAPGVAFDYRYAFRLPPSAIAGTQEAHAQACEKLGVARCRVTGMRYQLLGENKIEAMLAFRLDPTLARTFGKNAIDAVTAAKGMLVDARISGVDAGANLDRLAVRRAQLADELRQVEADLARPGLTSAERVALQNRRAELREQLNAATDGAVDERKSLATTPLVFEYGSGPAVRGFDASAPLASALDTALGSAQVTLAVLLGGLALFGPPALAFGLAWMLWRRVGRRWHPVAAAAA
ncbi:hypothetical protein [Sphingomonas lenta]|uniref:DUF4349 domain-containing protein n=1 Tax=Sphingomonas lenta TaxID=1141887 RepID=A0A2A2SB83_9SPHN|nr:hypothetical protein [Sphingomonas lenta]PAX06564.1 hypothetical protein CKY28_15540 [Sphingomonas lenta]